MPPLRYVPPMILIVDLVFMIFHRAIGIGLLLNHRQIRAKLPETFCYFLGECRGRGWGFGCESVGMVDIVVTPPMLLWPLHHR